MKNIGAAGGRGKQRKRKKEDEKKKGVNNFERLKVEQKAAVPIK